ncbi:xanthine dehydrogenase accessory protein XdhC [Actinomadura madurae]|uniref:xanthine dehydrogenase accessory protein XdhC n=1 Tax=Actinomadura madurae TaxID=1993 RepID=UPI00399B99DA
MTGVRGHTPREAGAKMVVSAGHLWGTVGGGNLEAKAVERARAMIASGTTDPAGDEVALSDKAPYVHGVQCCGGVATLLYEPLPVAPAVAVFGVGHVGLELARILSRHAVELHLVDSRAEVLGPQRLAVLHDARATVHVRHEAILPEQVLDALPRGAHVLIMTHDHAEDAALCDAALRRPSLGSIGLIGSTAKWARFQALLADNGHSAEAIARITTPIGIEGITSKDPAAIAVSAAAALLRALARESRDETAMG